MTLIRTLSKTNPLGRMAAITTVALFLAACSSEDVDDLTGSHLTQPPAGTPPRKPVDANDITIVGQEVAHSIMDLPVIAGAAVPPLVQFNGVTSIVVGPVPVDTDPYTELFRDRLLLLTRLKLRFVEHTLPPLIVSTPKKGKKKKETAPTPEAVETPDYQVLAEMRGHYDDDLYRIQVQFVDAHTGDVLFDGLYRIRKEAAPADPVPTPVDAAPNAPPNAPPPANQAPDYFQQGQTGTPAPQ